LLAAAPMSGQPGIGGAMKELQGKVALVTGGARGQGRSHALALAREGAEVVVTDAVEDFAAVPYGLASQEDLDETVRLVEREDVRCLAIKADVRSSEKMEAAVEQTVSELGSLDILCANAGIWAAAELTEMTDQQWQTVIDINLTGVFHSIRAAARPMREQGSGRIVATSSVAGRMGMHAFGNYVAAKWGVIGLVKTAALELAPYQVTANAVCPATVKTDMCFENEALYRLFQPEAEQPTTAGIEQTIVEGLHKIPDPWIEPEEVSATIVYLCSEQAKHISGTAIDISVGLSATWSA
jgi:SDR family mycofactocin-dependent oxidoreductase